MSTYVACGKVGSFRTGRNRWRRRSGGLGEVRRLGRKRLNRKPETIAGLS